MIQADLLIEGVHALNPITSIMSTNLYITCYHQLLYDCPQEHAFLHKGSLFLPSIVYFFPVEDTPPYLSLH